MLDRPNKTLGKALEAERQRMASQTYPGDLAEDVLQQQASLLMRLRNPALATAVIGLGVIAIFAMTQPGNPPTNNAADLAAQPAPQVSDPPVPGKRVAGPTPARTEPLPPAEQVAATKLPEIDRDLLPLQRNSQTTWLASAAIPKQQLERQTRLAQHPDTKQRIRLTLSAPNRTTISRATARPLKLQSAPKPERTS